MFFQFFALTPKTALIVHGVLEYLAIAVGVWIYRRIRRQKTSQGILHRTSFTVVLGCILGAAIGNKLVFWIEFADKIPALWHGLMQRDPQAFALLFSGQSIVGGLLGGLIGIEIAKKSAGLTQSTGDDFVLPIIVGTIIGRIGCFLAGLNDGTYGIPSTLPWAIDFGDGIPRHPTQLYDILFAILMYFILWRPRDRWQAQPGLLFKFYLLAYLIWRLFIDSYKPVPYSFAFGLSGIQVVCLVAIACYAPIVWRHYQLWRQKTKPSLGVS